MESQFLLASLRWLPIQVRQGLSIVSGLEAIGASLQVFVIWNIFG